MKSEEKSIQAISAQAHSEAADNRLLRKKLQARDKRVVELEAMVSNLNKQLCEKVDQLNDMIQKLVAFMTGNGEINLSDSLREAVVAGVRAEFEAREQILKETYGCELEFRLLCANVRFDPVRVNTTNSQFGSYAKTVLQIEGFFGRCHDDIEVV